jgi:hypothetical protein
MADFASVPRDSFETLIHEVDPRGSPAVVPAVEHRADHKLHPPCASASSASASAILHSARGTDHPWHSVVAALALVVLAGIATAGTSHAQAIGSQWVANATTSIAAPVSSLRSAEASDPFFDDYRSMAGIAKAMQRWVGEAQRSGRHPDARYNASVGRTWEGRGIPMVSVGGGPGAPLVYVQATLHAREWVAAAAALWVARELLTSADPRVAALVRAYRWAVVPVANPDGYEFSRTRGNRLWRKNRNPNAGTEGKIHRVDPGFGSTLTASNRVSQSNCWVNWKMMGQPCEFQVRPRRTRARPASAWT